MRGKRYLILVVVFFMLAYQSVNAQEVSITPTPTSTPVQYSLPYPGILPGNPLFFLKTIRDNIISFMISNPQKKAEFNLLQADKSFATGQYLLDKNQDEVQALVSFNQGNKYFEDALEKLKEANQQGFASKDFAKKLSLANLKYQEIILGVIEKAKGEDKKQLLNELTKVKNLGKQAALLQRK